MLYLHKKDRFYNFTIYICYDAELNFEFRTFKVDVHVFFGELPKLYSQLLKVEKLELIFF